MPNPFKELKTKTNQVKVEDVEGQFDCLEVVDGRRCNEYVRVAKYIPSERILTWKCALGHVSVLEDVDDE